MKLDPLVRLGTPATYNKAGLLIFRQGDLIRQFYLLVDGSVHVMSASLSGKDAIIGRVSAGSFFGEEALVSTMRGTERMYTAVTETPCKIVAIPGDKVTKLIRAGGEPATEIVSELVTRISTQHADLLDMMFNHTGRRLARAIAHRMQDEGVSLTAHGSVSVTMPTQSELADTIGSTRSRVNAYLSKWRLAGLIDYDTKRGSLLTIHPAFLRLLHSDFKEQGFPDDGIDQLDLGRK